MASSWAMVGEFPGAAFSTAGGAGVPAAPETAMS
jgi:hypothetical protein